MRIISFCIYYNNNNKIFYYLFKLCKLFIYLNKWGLGIGDWGLGIGDWGLGPIPNPQSPIPIINILNLLFKNIFY